MTLVVTPVPGNAVRVDATCCNASTVVHTGTLSPRQVGRIVADVEPQHQCAV